MHTQTPVSSKLVALYNLFHLYFTLFSHLISHCAGNTMDANVGVMYMQNVAPDGPVAWMIAEVPDRQLR